MNYDHKKFYNKDPWNQCNKMIIMQITMVILTLLLLGLKYCVKLPPYLSLPLWGNVIKLFIAVIYCHSMAITMVILFYNTECHQHHIMVINYTGKFFITLAPGLYEWHCSSKVPTSSKRCVT
jgi:hypothetical protein